MGSPRGAEKGRSPRWGQPHGHDVPPHLMPPEGGREGPPRERRSPRGGREREGAREREREREPPNGKKAPSEAKAETPPPPKLEVGGGGRCGGGVCG